MAANYWDDPSDDLEDREYPDADPWEEESTDTIACAACGAEVYEDAVQCPVCGEYMMPETSIWAGKPSWWITLGVLGIIALTAALVIGMG